MEIAPAALAEAGCERRTETGLFCGVRRLQSCNFPWAVPASERGQDLADAQRVGLVGIAVDLIVAIGVGDHILSHLSHPKQELLPAAQAWAAKVKDEPIFYVLASGPNYGVAYSMCCCHFDPALVDLGKVDGDKVFGIGVQELQAALIQCAGAAFAHQQEFSCLACFFLVLLLSYINGCFFPFALDIHK